MSSVSGIYVITNIKNGKIYIGQAQKIKKRWDAHKSMLVNSKHPNKYLQNAWNKYGEKSFKFRVLEYCPIELLDEREQHYLDIYMPKGICYNISIDAISGMRGRKASDGTRSKIRSVRTGTSLKEETKRKLSEINTGKTLSPEHRKKIGMGNKGKVRTPESIEKRVALYRGRKQSQEEIESRVSQIRKHYCVISPDGKTFDVVGMKDFCQIWGLNANCMSAVAHHRQDNHYGWKCYLIEDKK